MTQNKQEKFQAMNDYVQVEPMKVEEEKRGKIIIAETKKQKPARGKVLSLGQGIGEKAPDLKPGDIILFNPHLVQEIEDDKGTIYITNISTIYGKYGQQ